MKLIITWIFPSYVRGILNWPNITLKRDAPFRGGFEGLFFFGFGGGFANLP
jgi:hypothetical protein